MNNEYSLITYWLGQDRCVPVTKASHPYPSLQLVRTAVCTPAAGGTVRVRRSSAVSAGPSVTQPPVTWPDVSRDSRAARGRRMTADAPEAKMWRRRPPHCACAPTGLSYAPAHARGCESRRGISARRYHFRVGGFSEPQQRRLQPSFSATRCTKLAPWLWHVGTFLGCCFWPGYQGPIEDKRGCGNDVKCVTLQIKLFLRWFAPVKLWNELRIKAVPRPSIIYVIVTLFVIPKFFKTVIPNFFPNLGVIQLLQLNKLVTTAACYQLYV